MKSATLDTSLLLEYWKKQDKRAVVERLLDLAEAGELDLAVTGRIRDDIPRPPLSNRIDDLHELNVGETGAVFRLDMSVLDGPDMLGDDDFLQVSYKLNRERRREGKSAPDWRDWDHLHAHFLTGRDVFLTWDGAVLDIAGELANSLGLTVLAPEDFLAEHRTDGTA